LNTSKGEAWIAAGSAGVRIKIKEKTLPIRQVFAWDGILRKAASAMMLLLHVPMRNPHNSRKPLDPQI
jgi:hypothetical protein